MLMPVGRVETGPLQFTEKSMCLVRNRKDEIC